MQVIEIFLRNNDTNFPELAKFNLSDMEWNVLTMFQDIMKVGDIKNILFTHTYLFL